MFVSVIHHNYRKGASIGNPHVFTTLRGAIDHAVGEIRAQIAEDAEGAKVDVEAHRSGVASSIDLDPEVEPARYERLNQLLDGLIAYALKPSSIEAAVTAIFEGYTDDYGDSVTDRAIAAVKCFVEGSKDKEGVASSIDLDPEVEPRLNRLLDVLTTKAVEPSGIEAVVTAIFEGYTDDDGDSVTDRAIVEVKCFVDQLTPRATIYWSDENGLAAEYSEMAAIEQRDNNVGFDIEGAICLVTINNGYDCTGYSIFEAPVHSGEGPKSATKLC